MASIPAFFAREIVDVMAGGGNFSWSKLCLYSSLHCAMELEQGTIQLVVELPSEKIPLSTALIEAGPIGTRDIERAARLAKTENLSLDRAILKLGLMEETPLLRMVAMVEGVLFNEAIEPGVVCSEAVGVLTREYCRSHSILPLMGSAATQPVATSDPCNKQVAAEIGFLLNKEVALVAVPSNQIRAALSSELEDTNETAAVSEQQAELDQETHRKDESDGPVIRFVSEVIRDAVDIGSSDIHFEVQEDGLRIRLRVDGVLRSHPVDNALSVSSILARVKVMAGMNVSERRLPQDGRLTSIISGRKVDFRVSSVPTSFGESIVCRVLDPKALRLGWEKLGFDSGLVSRIVNLIEQPSGLFLVTGPTGSGKTTTLYTALAHLNREGRKILTIEDPVEYNLAGVEQVQVHEEVGMTFARALRSFLRQDPDVIMVGEIRDAETAEIACRAALVGRLVLSTLHTGAPEDASTRLVDLGVPEYLVRDVLLGVLGQSLVPGHDTGRTLEARLA